jgi:hypothetical protein
MLAIASNHDENAPSEATASGHYPQQIDALITN